MRVASLEDRVAETGGLFVGTGEAYRSAVTRTPGQTLDRCESLSERLKVVFAGDYSNELRAFTRGCREIYAALPESMISM
jgi:hypothetical protein